MRAFSVMCRYGVARVSPRLKGPETREKVNDTDNDTVAQRLGLGRRRSGSAIEHARSESDSEADKRLLTNHVRSTKQLT
jgi:hypothetical protein